MHDDNRPIVIIYFVPYIINYLTSFIMNFAIAFFYFSFLSIFFSFDTWGIYISVYLYIIVGFISILRILLVSGIFF